MAKHELVKNNHYFYTNLGTFAKAYGVCPATVFKWLKNGKAIKFRIIVNEKEDWVYMYVDDFFAMKREINFLARHIQYTNKCLRKRSI